MLLCFKCGGCADVHSVEIRVRVCWSVLMLPLLSFRTLVSRKFTVVEVISCVNLMHDTTLVRYSTKALRESLSPFQIRNISSMKRFQSIM